MIEVVCHVAMSIAGTSYFFFEIVFRISVYGSCHFSVFYIYVWGHIQ